LFRYCGLVWYRRPGTEYFHLQIMSTISVVFRIGARLGSTFEICFDHQRALVSIFRLDILIRTLLETGNSGARYDEGVLLLNTDRLRCRS
jgi:hypothetical protein